MPEAMGLFRALNPFCLNVTAPRHRSARALEQMARADRHERATRADVALARLRAAAPGTAEWDDAVTQACLASPHFAKAWKKHGRGVARSVPTPAVEPRAATPEGLQLVADVAQQRADKAALLAKHAAGELAPGELESGLGAILVRVQATNAMASELARSTRS